MLRILFSSERLPNTIYSIHSFFSEYYEPEWVDSEFGRAVIQDVDKSTVISGLIIDSPALGLIAPTSLSGGTKRLLFLKFEGTGERTMCITGCGENCAKWLQRLGAEKDLDVQLGYPMAFSDDEPFPIYIKNLDRVCNNYGEYRRAYGELLCTENKL
mgnify:FL=1